MLGGQRYIYFPPGFALASTGLDLAARTAAVKQLQELLDVIGSLEAAIQRVWRRRLATKCRVEQGFGDRNWVPSPGWHKDWKKSLMTPQVEGSSCQAAVTAQLHAAGKFQAAKRLQLVLSGSGGLCM